MSLLAPENLPFAIALGAVLVLALLQFFNIGDFDFDADVDVDAGVGDAGVGDAGVGDAGVGDVGLMGSLTTLLGLGRVPFIVWLMAFLFLFAAIGLGIQELAASFIGGPLDALLAGVLSLVATLPVTAGLVRPLGRLMPRDESTAVGLDSLVGRRAQITTGRARNGYPARARVRDLHGHAHHVMVEPHEPDGEHGEGDEVLLVRREGNVFYGVALAERVLAPLA